MSHFANPIACVGALASRPAHSPSVLSSSDRGTTLFASPMRSASAAGMSSPKKNSSFAFCGPTRRVSRYAPPASGAMPRRMNT